MESVSTLLIPDRLVDYYFRQVRRHKNSRKRYFAYLLRCYGSLLESHPIQIEEKLTTTYQEREQMLRRVNFRPNPWDWQSHKSLARMHGISMTRLFVFLMTLEMAGIEPSKPRISGRRARLRRQLLRFAVFIGLLKGVPPHLETEWAIFWANHYEKFSFFGRLMSRKGKISLV